MKRLFLIALALGALCVPGRAARPAASGQQPEFLDNNEIYQLREAAQDPIERLKLYVNFAKVRIETIQKAAAGKDKNRGEQIHDAIYEYDRIINAIDKNVDEAEKRRDIFKKGLQYALDQVPGFLKQLEALRAANAEDLEQYKFVLDQAIENTRDDAESLTAVLKKQPTNRKEEKEAKAAAAKAEKDRASQAARDNAASDNAKGTPAAKGATTTDPNSRPGWNPKVGPPTRKKSTDDQQQKPPQKDPPGF